MLRGWRAKATLCRRSALPPPRALPPSAPLAEQQRRALLSAPPRQVLPLPSPPLPLCVRVAGWAKPCLSLRVGCASLRAAVSEGGVVGRL